MPTETIDHQHPEGVQLQTYLPRLVMADLKWLNWLATNRRLTDKAAELCHWLGRVLDAELDRREAAEADADAAAVFEAEPVHINCVEWDNAALANALTAIKVMLQAVEDRPGLVEFLNEVDVVLRGWIATRLKDSE